MEALKNYLLALGIPGLLVIVAIDSAGVPIPGGPDALVMLLSWQRPAMMPVFYPQLITRLLPRTHKGRGFISGWTGRPRKTSA